MNVQCPNCATMFRVDPAKVPERGVRARCSVCAAVFPVKRSDGPVAAAPSAPTAPAREVSAPPAREAAAPAPRPAPAPPPPPPQVATQPATPMAPPAIPGARPPQPRPGTTTPLPAPAAPPRPPAGGRTNPVLSPDPGQKARRLARALVSDMVVYHPAKRRDALKAGTIKESFKEEITKSWEEYVEQVGREIAESTPYFREALNEILGDGKPVF